MAGLLSKRRTQQEIQRADLTLLKKHDAYLEAWVRAESKSSRVSARPDKGNEGSTQGSSRRSKD